MIPNEIASIFSVCLPDGSAETLYCTVHIPYVVLTYLLTYLLTPWSKALLVKVTGSQLVNKFPAFMEPEGSLPHSQVPANCPYPEPDRSSP
jgi:hypothetical protein